jgi:beta-glucosidase
MAGQAIADIVTGTVNPSARLPITYPLFQDGGGIPYWHSVSDHCTAGDGPMPHYEYTPCQVQWPFGYGLSYTTFEFSKLSASGGIDQDLRVSVTVKNTGKVAGSTPVTFFTFDDFRSTTPEYKRLRAFQKVELEPGQEINVGATIPLEELRFVGPHDDHHYIIDPTMTSMVGVGAMTDCRKEPEGPLCARLEAKDPGQTYVGACEAACGLWENSGCSGSFGLSTRSCLDMCTSISKYPASAMNGNNDGWGWGYVNCLESVVWGNQVAAEKEYCWKLTTLCRDIFKTGQLDEFGIGSAENHPTTPNSSIPASNVAALITGLLTSLMIYYAMNGGSFWGRKKDRPQEGVQFSQIAQSEE